MGKKTLVYGMGLSGKGAARLLAAQKKELVLFDKNENIDMEAVKAEIGIKDAFCITGSLKKEDLKDVETMVLSPGVSAFCEDAKMAAGAGVKISGEVEEAYKASKGRLIAITGTNGKTTTTALCGEIMKAAFDEVFVVGNIGRSYAQEALNTSEKSVTVAEISSFQLETTDLFHPDVSAVLNLTPDHLDRHLTFENYAACKMRIALRQSAGEVCVINYDDEYLRSLAGDITPKKIYFSMKPLKEGVYYDGGIIFYSDGRRTQEVIKREEINLAGDHNIENVMAAAAISVSMGVSLDIIARVIRNFKAVEHRIEFTCEKKGVKYYNDSKGTNTDAAAKAVAAMTSPSILIAGGYDKGADFTDWIKGFGRKIKAMVLIGETAERIRETAISSGFTDIYMAKDLEDAVRISAQLADPGENVLLSPACASWDQFKNYEERGRLFKEYARALPD